MTDALSPKARSENPAILPRLKLATLFLGLFAMAVSLSFVFAVLPPIGRDLGLTELQVSLVVAPAALVFVIANGVWGLLIDRLGRKRVIVTAIAAATLATGAFGWIIHARLENTLSVAGAFILLCGSRIALGALAGGFLPAAQAFVADITSPELRTRALAITGAGFALGMVTGPGIAAAFSGLGAAVPFYAVAGLTGLATVIVLFGLVEPRHKTASAHATYGRTSFGKLWPLLLIVVLVYTTYAILLQVTGFRMQDQFALSGTEAAGRTGIALMVAAAGLVVTQIIVARLHMPTERSVRALMVGGLIALAAMALLWLAVDFQQQLFGMGLFGIGLGLALPSALGLLTVVADTAGDQGRVGGFSGAAQGLGMVFGPLAGAVFYQANHAAPYLVALALLGIVVAISAFVASRTRTMSRSNQPVEEAAK